MRTYFPTQSVLFLEPAGKVRSREAHWRRFLLPAGVKFEDHCGPDGGSMSKHMGLRTAPVHGSVLHVCGQGTGVCSTPHRMGVCSTPSFFIDFIFFSEVARKQVVGVDADGKA